MTKVSKRISRRNFLVKSSAGLASISIVPRFVLGGSDYIAPSDKVTLGFIGIGRLSAGLGKSFLKLNNTQMVAACDVDRIKLARFQKTVNEHYASAKGKESYEGCDTYEDFDQLIGRKDIDGVIVALPDHWHAIPAIAAMKAGKDVYCEKPLAHTIDEGRAMVTAARKYKRVLQTGSMQRSWKDFRHACELVRNGYLGEIKQVKVNVGDPAVACNLPEEDMPGYINWDKWIGPAPYRGFHTDLAPPHPEAFWPKWRDYAEFGGGMFSDWGAHMFDIAQWGLGMDHTGPVEIIPPEDRLAKRGLVFKYANGIEMTHEDFGRGWAVRFIGSKGTLDISRQFLDVKPENIAKKEIAENERKLEISEHHYANWINSIKSRRMPICDVEIGHRSASICNIGNIAYRLGRPLKWDPEKEKFEKDGEANKLRGKKYRKPYTL